MKAIAAILLALGVVTVSHAQSSNYKHAASRANFCSSMGGMSRVVYEARMRGEPKEKYLKLAADAMNKGDKADVLVAYAIAYGYDHATSSENAHMTVWAACMDETN